MEHVKGGDLQSKVRTLRPLGPDDAIQVMIQLVDAVAYMHSKNIMHRDLKLANILTSDDKKIVKIVDFGLATKADDVPYIFNRCGTPGYVAPEVFNAKDGTKYDVICDVFSLGVIFFMMYDHSQASFIY